MDGTQARPARSFEDKRIGGKTPDLGNPGRAARFGKHHSGNHAASPTSETGHQPQLAEGANHPDFEDMSQNGSIE
jgi:hypothetical protein